MIIRLEYRDIGEFTYCSNRGSLVGIPLACRNISTLRLLALDGTSLKETHLSISAFSSSSAVAFGSCPKLSAGVVVVGVGGFAGRVDDGDSGGWDGLFCGGEEADVGSEDGLSVSVGASSCSSCSSCSSGAGESSLRGVDWRVVAGSSSSSSCR